MTSVPKKDIEAMIYGASLDEYGLKRITWQPDVIYDIGANVGGVTLLAASLFPNSKIIAVEPQPDNFDALVETTSHLPNVIRVNKALAIGPVWRAYDSPGTGNWMFVGKDNPTFHARMVPADCDSVTLDQLVAEYGGDQRVVKMDCEAGELMILDHKPSSDAVVGARWVAAEFHVWGDTHVKFIEVKNKLMTWIYDLAQTHNVTADMHGACINLIGEKRV